MNCERCRAALDEGLKSLVGSVLINWYAPATGVKRRSALCGNCALLFREFLAPALLDDPEYLDAANKLRSAW